MFRDVYNVYFWITLVTICLVSIVAAKWKLICYHESNLLVQQEPNQTTECIDYNRKDMQSVVCTKTLSGNYWSVTSYGCGERYAMTEGEECEVIKSAAEHPSPTALCTCDKDYCNDENFGLAFVGTVTPPPWNGTRPPQRKCYKGEGIHKLSVPSKQVPCAEKTLCLKIIRGGKTEHRCGHGQTAVPGCRFVETESNRKEEWCFCNTDLCNDMNLGNSGYNVAASVNLWITLAVFLFAKKKL